MATKKDELVEYLWQKDKYLSQVKDSKNRIKILSLDIFDTLLFRTVNKPRDLAIKVAENARKKGYLAERLTPNEFYQIRVLAEQKSKTLKTNYKEVTLKDIYYSMPDNIGNKKGLMDIEIQSEKEACYLNPSIMSLIKYLKEEKKVKLALVSDMYLSSNQIKEILEYNGFPLKWIDTLLVSSEEGGNKASGFLFDKLLSSYPEIDKENILHIGDSKAADIDGAKIVGINSIHYDTVHFEKDTVFEAERIRHGVILPEIISLRKLANNLDNKYEGEAEKTFYKVGATVFGPFLSAFADWIVDICKKEEIKRVYPLMREGMLLSKLILKAAQNKKVDLTVKPLYVSRQSTALAAMGKFGQEEIESLLGRRHFSIKNLFEILELPEGLDKYREYKDVFVRESNLITFFDGNNLRNSIKKFLLKPDIQTKVEDLIRNKRKKLVNYLLQVADENLENIMTVDMGFSGTIAKSIELALKHQGLESKITHLLGIGEEKTKYHLLDGIDIRGFIGNAGENLDLIRPITKGTEVIDQLLMAGLNTTIDYKVNEDGNVEPVTKDNVMPPEEIKLKKICHQGILYFQQLWFYFSNNKPEIISKLLTKKRELCMLLHRLKDMPTYEEAVALGNLHHDDNLGSDKIEKICTEEDFKKLLEMGLPEFKSLIPYGYDYTGVRWGQAVITRHDPTYLFRYYLEQNNVDGYLKITSRIIKKVQLEGIREIVIYGAGDFGRSVLRAAKIYRINVSCFVDRKESLWGQYIDDIEIVSLDQVVKEGQTVFVIGSLAFIEEIKKSIEERYSLKGITPTIFSA